MLGGYKVGRHGLPCQCGRGAAPQTCANGVNCKPRLPVSLPGLFFCGSPAAQHDPPQPAEALAALDGVMEFDAGGLPATVSVPQSA